MKGFSFLSKIDRLKDNRTSLDMSDIYREMD